MTISASLFNTPMEAILDRCQYLFDRIGTILWIPYQIALGIPTGVTLDTSGEDAFPRGIVVSADGLKAYMLGANNATLYQYTLTSANELDTGTYDNVSFAVTNATLGLTIALDGSALFCFDTSDQIRQIDMSTAYDLSTASLNATVLSVATQETVPEGLAISGDGSKMYVVGQVNKTIFQYTLPTVNTLTGASYASLSKVVSTEATRPTGLAVHPDGSEIYMLGHDSGSNLKKAFSYTMTSGAINTASATGDSAILSTVDTIVGKDMCITADGTGLIVAGAAATSLVFYNSIARAVKG